MFDYERKPYLQRIFGHLYIYHHKTHLHVWFSVVRVRGSADCCQPGPGPAAGSEGGGVVTRHMHTLHSALRANCSPAAGLHEMAGHSDTKCKTKIRRDLSDSFLQDKCFLQPIICFEKITGTMLILSLSIRFVTRRSFRLRCTLIIAILYFFHFHFKIPSINFPLNQLLCS